MNKFSVVAFLALVAVVTAEPPAYSYKRPSLSYGVPSFGGSSFGGSGFGGGHGGGHGGGISFGHSGGSLSSGHGGGYHAVSSGYQTSEGLHIDPQLLHKVKQILLDQESREHSHHGGGYIGVPSGAYGVPSTTYGVPHHHGYESRVVGIELGGVRQGIQVAQYHQLSHAPSHGGYSYGGSSGGYSSHGSGISSFGGSGFGASGFGGGHSISSISIPSQSYGSPSAHLTVPSGSYGVPHH